MFPKAGDQHRPALSDAQYRASQPVERFAAITGQEGSNTTGSGDAGAEPPGPTTPEDQPHGVSGTNMAQAERTDESAGAPHEPVAVEYGQSAKHAIYVRDDEREEYGRSMRARTVIATA